MYIKKYPKRVTPPVNYAGCAFSLPSELEHLESDETKIHKARLQSKAPADTLVGAQGANLQADGESTQNFTPPENVSTEDTDIGPLSDNSLDGANSEDASGAISNLISEKFTLEDIISLAAVLLLISGNTDDELLLLAGLLLLIGQRD
jgi:hypothetical protein